MMLTVVSNLQNISGQNYAHDVLRKQTMENARLENDGPIRKAGKTTGPAKI